MVCSQSLTAICLQRMTSLSSPSTNTSNYYKNKTAILYEKSTRNLAYKNQDFSQNKYKMPFNGLCGI